MLKDTREAWLERGIAAMRDGMFKRHGAVVPAPLRVSCGFPSSGGKGSRKQTVGEYWSGKASDDGVPQIYISPRLGDPIKALETLAHELIHAVLIPGDPKSGHKKAFKRIAVGIGLEGKMTATHAGEKLHAALKAMAKDLGEYPHAGLNMSGRKKQTTRLLKCECACGYVCRVTRKWIEELGAPLCPCEFKGPGKYEKMIVHMDDEDGEDDGD